MSQTTHERIVQTARRGAAARINHSLISDSKRREAKTSAGRLAALQAERQRWQRKATIAGNKLADVQRAIEVLAGEMAAKLHEGEWLQTGGGK